MPTPSKPAERRQRRNKPKEIDSQVVELNTALVPDPPKGLSAARKREWQTVWSSELGASWNQDSDLIAVTRLFTLYDRLTKYEREAEKDGLVQKGSTGQKSLHPLMKAADALRSQVLALEDRMGLSPMARLKLGIALGDAQQSLDEMNRRLAAGEEDDDDEFDPRLTIIEAREI